MLNNHFPLTFAALIKNKKLDMATVTRENIGLLNDKISIKVDKNDYLPSFEKALKNYSKQANIPGFRKGMVPVGMIKKMYGQSLFTDEVLKSVDRQLTDYMTNEKLEIFAQPLPLEQDNIPTIDINAPAEYAFDFEVGLKPDYKVADVTQANIKRYKVEVADDMVNEELERLQTRNGKMTEPELVENDENVLNITFIESDEAGNEIEGGIKKENSLLVKYFAETFRPQLLGKKKDDSIKVQLSAAFEAKEREWILGDLGLDKNNEAAIDKYFKLVISKIGFVEKAELNEDFFEAAYPGKEIKTIEALKQAIKEGIQQYYDVQATNQSYDQLYHYLVDETKIDFPENFLKRWMESGGESPKTAEQVGNEYPSFINSLKWTLIIDKLVKENNIEVAPDDISEFAKQQLFGYMSNMGGGMDMEQPWVNDYVQRMMKDRKFVEDAFHRIQTDKVFATINEKASGIETPITLDAFNKIQDEHKHHH
jgi:trigger factor